VESHRLWSGVDRRRRTRVEKAVRRGEQVADARDAELAVAFARLQLQNLERVRGRRSWIAPVAIAAFFFAPALAASVEADVLLAIVLVIVGFTALQEIVKRVGIRRATRAAEEAEAANRRLIEGLS